MAEKDYVRDWNDCGQSDPYYGVLSDERFRNRNLDAASLEEFFASGTRHVEEVLRFIRASCDERFSPRNVLDFGCGVGRLVVAFAKSAERVTGVDISDGMLSEAARNCQKNGIQNVAFAKSLDDVTGPFDLVHSFIVFQHIPVPIGMEILRKLTGFVSENGVLAVHLTFWREAAWHRRTASRLRAWSPWLHRLMNLLQGRRASEPLLQMNEYSLDAIFACFDQLGFRQIHAALTSHSGTTGVMLVAKRRDARLF